MLGVFYRFPYGSAGKESACNAGDLGRTPGWEDPLETGKSTYLSILAWRIPGTTVRGVTMNQTLLSDFHLLKSSHFIIYFFKLQVRYYVIVLYEVLHECNFVILQVKYTNPFFTGDASH